MQLFLTCSHITPFPIAATHNFKSQIIGKCHSEQTDGKTTLWQQYNRDTQHCSLLSQHSVSTTFQQFVISHGNFQQNAGVHLITCSLAKDGKCMNASTGQLAWYASYYNENISEFFLKCTDLHFHSIMQTHLPYIYMPMNCTHAS